MTLKDNTFDVSNGDGSIVISGGAREYIVRFSQEDYAYAINDTETAGDSASGIQGATIELGEHLYNGDLKLYDNATDDFGRPARKWEFNGKTIGTYVKEELSVAIYGARRNATTGNYVKDSKVNQIGGIGTGSTISNVKLAVEDFPAVTSMKKDDYMPVTVAAGDVIAVKEPEILSGVTISGFKVNSDVVVDGQKYEFTTTAHYKDSDLAYYTGDNALLHEDYVSKSDTRTSGDGEWVWSRTLFDENGNEVTLTERDDSASYLKNMNKNQNYLIKLDSKGEVYRAYRLPGDTAGSVTQMPTVAEAGLVGYDSTKSAADNKDAEYVTDPDDIGTAVRAGKNQMLISCDVLNNKMPASESGVLYVNNSKDSGILVNSDTKIVLIQINRNNRDTYTDGVGFSDVKSIIEGLNEDRDNNNYHYKISAVADKRVAKSIVIWDYTKDWTEGTSDEGEGTGNMKTALKGSSAEAKYTISKSGILKLNLTYTAPAFAVKKANSVTGSMVTMPDIDVYEGTTWIDTITFAPATVEIGTDGKARFSYTSTKGDFDEDKVTDPNDLTFKLSGDETLSKVVVRYFEDAAKTKQIDSSVLATDTSVEWGTTATAASGFKLGFKAGTYKDTTINANSNSITISGMYDTTNDAAYVKGTTETIKANGTDYVDVVITGLEKADPTYTVTNTDKTDKALSTWRVTGDDAGKTLTIAVTGATADGDSEAKSGLNINDSVSGTVTLSAAPDNDGVYGYRVKSTKPGLDTILVDNTAANWSIRVSGNMTISPSDLTVTPVTTFKITDIKWDKGEIRITFNKAVLESTVTTTNFAATVASGATLTVDVDEANNNVVAIKAAAGKDIAANDTVIIKKEVASDLAGESTVTVAIAPNDTSATTPTDVEVGAVGYTVTLTAGGNATVAKKDA